MKTVLLNLLAMIVRALIDAKLFEHIQALVVIVGTRHDLTGEQKKALVYEKLEELKGDVYESFKKAGSSYINFAIESAVVLLKGGKIG